MKVRNITKRRSRTPELLTRAKRGPLYRPSLAEEIAIARGIAADPDARELRRGEMRRMRPFYEGIVMEQLGHRFKHLRAADYLKSCERDARYLEAARTVANRLDHLSILVAAEHVVQEARLQRMISRDRLALAAPTHAQRFDTDNA